MSEPQVNIPSLLNKPETKKVLNPNNPEQKNEMFNSKNKQDNLMEGVRPVEVDNKIGNKNFKSEKPQYQIYWITVIFFSLSHLGALYGIYLGFTNDVKYGTLLFGFFLHQYGAFSVCAGAHRLWAHRAYKATWQLKGILLFGQTLAFQFSLIWWVRNHRTHHKASDTDADPHNANRGFFFSHIGWICRTKLDEVIEKGKTIDLSDLYKEPLIRWQHQYYWVVMPIICYFLPTILPMLLWEETLENAIFVNITRHVLLLHVTWLVNSAAHLWGSKPYDKNIKPANNPIVSLLACGEGWHNYHHTFPWDYRASEFGNINPTLTLLNIFAKIGWAYDLKTASTEMIKNRVDRTGDGSHEIWGWGDQDQTLKNRESAVIYYKKG